MISAKNLTKQFISSKKKPGLLGALESLFYREPVIKNAVESFDLEINQGEMIGLLGPNGAGKTTLMKMFTGIIVPSSGELKILGHEPAQRHKEFRKNIALVMGQKSQLWWDIPAMDSFLLLKRYYEIPEEDFKQRVAEMSALLSVESLMNIHVRRLSLGERMKMELMASLLHSPKVIFLDEPTIGLDLVAQENIRQFILDYHRKTHATLVITSHYMADVQALCQRLVLIFDGKKAFDGPLKTFETILGNDKIVSFQFADALTEDASLFADYSPVYQEDRKGVELKIPLEKLRSVTSEALEKFEITEFNTDKMPIEKVMKTLMTNPQLLKRHSL